MNESIWNHTVLEIDKERDLEDLIYCTQYCKGSERSELKLANVGDLARIALAGKATGNL